jgi:ech hydrogenase subunit D
LSADKFKNVFVEVKPDEFLNHIKQLNDQGFRIVQICCTKTDFFELTYSFDKGYDLTNIRVNLESGNECPSISDFYPSAFLYENEIQEQFGIKYTGMNIDYGGKFYKTREKNAYLPKKNPAS